MHIGKTFKTGVPKHRLGERERNVLAHLDQLLHRDVQVTVLVGDLFDKVRVSNNALNDLIDIIERAVEDQPNKRFVILNGNHDMPKEVDRVSSFHLLEKYFTRNPADNLMIVSKHSEENVLQLDDVLLYFSHYNPYLSLDQEVTEDILTETQFQVPVRIAFGHWETIDFGSDHFIDRDVPKNVLKQFNAVVTGHEHKPKLSIIDNVPVLTSGSMEPYAYGEELPTEKGLYTTTDIQTVERNLSKDPEHYSNSYVKIILQHDDEMPSLDFNCLAKTFKRVSQPKEDKKDNGPNLHEDPLSFHVSWIELLEQIGKEDPTQKDLLEYVERTFLDKSYKENT